MLLWNLYGGGSRALESLAPGDTPFFKDLNCYKILNFLSNLSLRFD